MKFKLEKDEKVVDNTKDIYKVRQDLVGLVSGQTPVQTITGEYLGSDGTVNTFDGLIDTPTTKVGNGGDILVVNSEENGIVYESPDATYLKLDGSNGPISGVLDFNKGITVNTDKTGTADDDLHVHGDAVDNLIQTDASADALGFYNQTPITKQTAITAKDAGTVNTGDATSDGVINNNRTRIEEIETRLKNLGLIS